jgi:hypothetical protein
MLSAEQLKLASWVNLLRLARSLGLDERLFAKSNKTRLVRQIVHAMDKARGEHERRMRAKRRADAEFVFASVRASASCDQEAK